MAEGPGNYDAECSIVREMTDAEVVVVAVINGTKGSGFSVQSYQQDYEQLADMLEFMAKELRNGG